MRRKLGIFTLLITAFFCLTFGLVACGEKDGRVNPKIVVETDSMEIALDIVDSDYTMPLAGVYYENLDRVDGVEIRMSLIDPTGGYIYENVLDYKEMRFPFTGKYELVYKAEGCEDVVVTIYVCDRLEMGVDFTLEGNTLSWAAIPGAIGYDVTVNGAEPTFTETASFTSDIFAEQGFYVGVTAKGDNKVWIDSYMSSYENRIPLQGGELAAFNNPCYELDLVEATPNSYNGAPEGIKYVTEEECAGSTGGALKFVMKSGEYGTGLFRVKLQKTVDKNEEFDGMEVRFKLDSSAYIYETENDPTRLILAQPAADERRVSRGTYVYEGHNDSWQVMKIPKAAVESFDGLKFLQFSLYNMTRSGGTGTLYLDYIRLYKDEIATPANVAISGENLDWDDVEGACEYVISVDKTDDANDYLHRSLYYATESQIALASLGIDAASATQQYEIQVMAVSADTTVGSSAWSEKLVKRATLEENVIAAFDNAIYEMDVVNPVLNDGAKSFGHLYYKGYEQVSGAEGGSALRLALFAQSTYGTFSAFTVNLTKPLNLESNYDCVILRFKVESSNYANNETLGIQLAGSKKDSQNYNTGSLFRKAVKVGEWMEYQLTIDELKTFYETGDTKLSFVLINTEANKSGGTVFLVVALDSIKYYNSVDVPANVRVEDKALKWDAVEGANGYTVSVNGVAYSGITETTYDLSSLTGANELKVLAESASSEFASSVYSAAVYYEVLEDDELATFNHAGYLTNVVAGNPNTVGATTKGSIRASEFNAELGANGAIGLKMQGDTSSWRIAPSTSHIVTVNLAKPLDLTNNAGLQVKFLVEWISKPANTTEMRFMILHATTIDKDYRGGEAKAGYVVATADATKTNFQSLTVTAEQLKAIGYKDGDTYLTLNLWTNGDTLPGGGGSAQIWLDEISYCKMIAAPASVTFDENVMKWSAVDGASGYVVSVDGEETTVTGTTFDLTPYQEKGSVVVKVKALPENTEEWEPSVWTTSLTKYFLKASELANFNQEGYISQVVAGNPNATNNTTKGTIRTATFNAGVGTGGAVEFKIQGDTSTWTSAGRMHIVTVNFSKALDLTNNAGITVKFLVSDRSNNANITEMRFMALHATTIDMDYRKGEAKGGYVTAIMDTTKTNFQTLTITKDQLTTLGYKDGMTYLTLGLWTNVDTSAALGGSLWLWLDDISYYQAN